MGDWSSAGVWGGGTGNGECRLSPVMPVWYLMSSEFQSAKNGAKFESFKKLKKIAFYPKRRTFRRNSMGDV